MTFEDEWGKLREESARQQRTATQLDHVPTDPGGGSPDLASAPARKAAAVKALKEQVRPHAKTGAEKPEETSTKASTGFKSWATGGAVSDALTKWKASAKALQAALQADEDNLLGVKKSFASNDNLQWNQFTTLIPPTTHPVP
ncbi:hypothetical protein ACZ90_61815 [Streptomyces albus subsp. albus]|nr:hypothetical protein ACZ90_61815 [Streptomyces albus subsp. albus]